MLKTFILSMLVALLLVVALAPGVARSIGDKLDDHLFSFLHRSGLLLTMADVNGRGAAEIAAGRKLMADSQGKHFVAVCETPTTYTAASGDTVGTGIVLKKGSRLLNGVTLSNAANTASLTCAVGLRDAITKVAVDATAIAAATAITSAANAAVFTGTKLTAGQRYILPQDCEIYFTLASATPTANAAIRCEVPYLAPG